MTATFDVVISGGGPAGCAAALTLLRYSSLRVAVIERGSYDQWRVGETLSPGVQPLLHYLDAESILEEGGQLRNYGTAAAWGSADVVSRDFLFVAAGVGWHLDRARFDAGLAALVRERGGTLREGCVIESETREPSCGAAAPGGDPWRLSLSDGTEIGCRFVIDAGGRHASFARRQGAAVDQRDHLMGVVVALDRVRGDGAGGTLVESAEDGWWYSAALPDGSLVVAFLSDADIIRERRLHEVAAWREHLGTTRATRRRAGDAEIVRGPSAHPAQSQIVAPPWGDGWIAAGEAAVAFDPLSSMGIGYALASGIQAARIAAHPTAEACRSYAEDVAQHFAAYLERKRGYYLLEQRWKSAFWERRQG